jgi:hypothetical protein
MKLRINFRKEVGFFNEISLRKNQEFSEIKRYKKQRLVLRKKLLLILTYLTFFLFRIVNRSSFLKQLKRFNNRILKNLDNSTKKSPHRREEFKISKSFRSYLEDFYELGYSFSCGSQFLKVNKEYIYN